MWQLRVFATKMMFFCFSEIFLWYVMKVLQQNNVCLGSSLLMRSFAIDEPRSPDRALYATLLQLQNLIWDHWAKWSFFVTNKQTNRTFLLYIDESINRLHLFHCESKFPIAIIASSNVWNMGNNGKNRGVAAPWGLSKPQIRPPEETRLTSKLPSLELFLSS